MDFLDFLERFSGTPRLSDLLPSSCWTTWRCVHLFSTLQCNSRWIRRHTDLIWNLLGGKDVYVVTDYTDPKQDKVESLYCGIFFSRKFPVMGFNLENSWCLNGIDLDHFNLLRWLLLQIFVTFEKVSVLYWIFKVIFWIKLFTMTQMSFQVGPIKTRLSLFNID